MKRFYLTAGLLLPLALTGCSDKEQTGNTQSVPVQVKVVEVSPSVLNSSGRFSGTVEEAKGTALSFSVMGTIQTIHVKTGDRVAKGQLIATLDSTSIKSSHAAAAATLVQAEDAYRRMKELHDKGSLPEIKWVEVQSQLQQAQAMEAVARKQLNDCRLVSPYSGIISEKIGETGQNVTPGLPVAQLVTATGQQVKIAVPEAEIGKITTGQQARITVAALNGRSYQGVVTERGVVADALSRSYEVKLRVTDADDSLLPGMVTTVALAAPDSRTAYILPAHIVQLDEQNRTFVWVDNGGKAEKRVIACGDFTADGVVVTDGLADGDHVIVEGQQKVCNGTAVIEAHHNKKGNHGKE